jgi:hypothetical protein
MNILGYRAFSTELLKIATEVRDPDIRAMISEAHGKEYLNGGALRANSEAETNFKPKLAAPSSFMAYTPVGTYNVRGKKPTATGSGYETASNFAGTALRGGMTGAGAATLAHTLRHGHDLKLAPKHLGMAVAGGAGLALADRALRRNAVKKQLTKVAMFSPARQLHATQSRGDFENKVHHTPLKSSVPTIGRDFRLPPQGA